MPEPRPDDRGDVERLAASGSRRPDASNVEAAEAAPSATAATEGASGAAHAPPHPPGFEDAVARRERRKLRARREPDRGLAFGLGLFGLVGWSVAVPTLAGIALGVWIDRTWPSRFSWTLMLLVAGVALGSFNAWRWLEREGGDARDDVDSGAGDDAESDTVAGSASGDDAADRAADDTVVGPRSAPPRREER